MCLILRVRIEMLLQIFAVLGISRLANSFNVYESARIPTWNHFGYSWNEPKQSAVFRKPMDAMVDLTNDLGVAILQDYAYSRSNFAFSPYGVASVLVVLYEGARGESARQIHRAVKFPWDRDITRIGFRDIHRHLRSYFSHEGYLSGITLSKQGSSLKPEYKRVLRFYGYDVDVSNSDKSADVPQKGDIIPNEVTSHHPQKGDIIPNEVTSHHPPPSSASTEDSVNDLTTSSYIPAEEDSVMYDVLTTEVPTTENLPTTVNGELGEGTELNELTTEVNNELGYESEIVTTTISPEYSTDIPAFTTTQPETTSVAQMEETEVPTTTTSTEEDETTYPGSPDVVDSTTEFGKKEDESEVLTTISSTSSDIEDDHLMETDNSLTEKMSQLKDVTETVVDKAGSIDDLDNGMLIPQGTSQGRTYYDPKTGTFYNVPVRSPVEEITLRKKDPEDSEEKWKAIQVSMRKFGDRTEWERQSLEDFLAYLRKMTVIDGPGTNQTMRLRGNLEGSIRRRRHSDQMNLERRGKAIDFSTSANIGKRNKRSKIKRTVSELLKAPIVPDLSLQLQNGMFDSHVSRNSDLYRKLPKLLFLVDGSIDTPVPMMTYTNKFPFAYVPKLHAQALEFPLDDERYKLLILLPVERRGLRQMIYDLNSYSLRDIVESLQPTQVKAVVPTFMVEGFVILTPSLQKIGIWDVFDPRKADLSGMTTDPELYVRNIEQSVTVIIRNYVEILDIQTRTMAARHMEQNFVASHPFLYFVMDTTTNVALMAGQMLDPLNSRIY